jgi:adenylosuccinate synthase
MPVTAVLGAQWGDEGKGKIVDNMSKQIDVVARFQGGANAGHTIVVNGRETILHQLPSGILRESTDCVLGNGMVIDPVGLVDEIERLRREGAALKKRIHVSILAHIVTPLHKLLDAKSETERGTSAIGTTQRGIGPCYADKINRCGLQVKNLDSIDNVKSHIQQKINRLQTKVPLTPAELESLQGNLEQFYHCISEIVRYTVDTSRLMHDYIIDNKRILIEGAQGTMLDIDFGSYPFVTSSNTFAGNIPTGLGISPKSIDTIIGVYKSYTTRVGAGPFPTELKGNTGDYLQRTGNEFGATTRRKRRCGWFDAAIGTYAARINGFSSFAITKLDVLDGLEEIKICTHYQNGTFPSIDLADAIPCYISMPGWQKDISGARTFGELPANAQAYVHKLADLLQIPLEYISVGKEREQIIHL